MESYKYTAIIEWAKESIIDRGLISGDRFFSETELCEIHNVSRQTVRQALAILEREGIILRRQGSGTFVQAQSRHSDEKTVTVGLISTYFSDYIFPSIITGIEQVLKKNHINLQISTTHNQVTEEARALRAMLSQDIDGLIVEPSQSGLPSLNAEIYNEIRLRNIPLVFFNAKYPESSFPYVAMDDITAGRIAADHLIACRHRKISAIFLLDDIQGHLRYKGFMKSLLASGVSAPENRVMWFSSQDRDEIMSVYEKKLLNLLADSTGIVCYNDYLAVELLEFCKQHGINVPVDVSIVGIDDAKRAGICEVPLTTVQHPKQELGKKVAEVLLQLIANPNEEIADVIFEPKLVERASVKLIPT
ncbi:MAG: GntR family transcriptional regulator [Clostridiales bacterium]|jgi:GntR family transcriptional regulator of arabinose operon|nr:GntR family transcriptional regulator [Clostridiales bacterium]